MHVMKQKKLQHPKPWYIWSMMHPFVLSLIAHKHASPPTAKRHPGEQRVPDWRETCSGYRRRRTPSLGYLNYRGTTHRPCWCSPGGDRRRRPTGWRRTGCWRDPGRGWGPCWCPRATAGLPCTRLGLGWWCHWVCPRHRWLCQLGQCSWEDLRKRDTQCYTMNMMNKERGQNIQFLILPLTIAVVDKGISLHCYYVKMCRTGVTCIFTCSTHFYIIAVKSCSFVYHSNCWG